MPTDTTVNNLVINKLTKAQYDAIQSPSDTELYLVPDVIDTTPTSGSDNMVTSGGVYTALSNKADASDIPTESTVSGWGFTKNTGTITGITMNNASKGTSGVVDLGTVVTDVSGKADKSEMNIATSGDQTTITLKSGTSATVINQHQSLNGYVPTTRTVNGKALSADITLSASDVSALPSSTVIPSAPGTLDTTATTAQSTSGSEALSGNVTLHKVAKTGTYSDLIGIPTIPTVPSNIVTGTSSSYTIWAGTQAQYEAIATKDATTIYLITGS